MHPNEGYLADWWQLFEILLWILHFYVARLTTRTAYLPMPYLNNT